ncbi:MAG: hypothetical protein ACREEX_10625, partial [Caulobacteraceae bacterium]
MASSPPLGAVFGTDLRADFDPALDFDLGPVLDAGFRDVGAGCAFAFVAGFADLAMVFVGGFGALLVALFAESACLGEAPCGFAALALAGAVGVWGAAAPGEPPGRPEAMASGGLGASVAVDGMGPGARPAGGI